MSSACLIPIDLALSNVPPCYSLSFKHLRGIEPIQTVPEKREKQFLAEGLQHFANGAPLLEAVYFRKRFL